jgi:hypothetical protein
MLCQSFKLLDLSAYTYELAGNQSNFKSYRYVVLYVSIANLRILLVTVGNANTTDTWRYLLKLFGSPVNM